MRVSNIEENLQVLDNVPYVERADLAITFHIAVEENEAGRASAIVTNNMMENFGVTRNQLYKDALENSSFIAPVMIDNLGEVVGRMEIEEMEARGRSEEEIRKAEERIYVESQYNPMFVVTNETLLYGGSAIFIRESWISLAKY